MFINFIQYFINILLYSLGSYLIQYLTLNLALNINLNMSDININTQYQHKLLNQKSTHYQQTKQLTSSITLKNKQTYCTKQIIFNHQTMYINTDDFSNSPSFLKMSLQNTPLLKKIDTNLSLSGKQINKGQIDIMGTIIASLEQRRIGEEMYESKQIVRKMQSTIKTCKKQAVLHSQQLFTENSVEKGKNKENKENLPNLQTLRNKKTYRNGDFDWSLYEMDNLIKIVDNMYQKAIEKKIQCNVNIQISNKNLNQNQNQTNALKQIHQNQQQISQQQSKKTQQAQKFVHIQIQQLKQKAKAKQIQKKLQMLNIQGSRHKQNYQIYCKIIQQQCDDRLISQTQRVSIQILPQQDQNQYKCKQQQPQQQIQIQLISNNKSNNKNNNNVLPSSSSIKSHKHTQSLGLQLQNSQTSQQISYNYLQSQLSQQNKQKHGSLTQRKIEPYIKIIHIKDLQNNINAKCSKSKSNLINYTVSKYNQTLKSKPSKIQQTFQSKPKTYSINSKLNLQQIEKQKNKQNCQQLLEIPVTHYQNVQENRISSNTTTTQGNSKRVYEQILSEYTTAKLLAISKKQYNTNNTNNKSTNKINGQDYHQQNTSNKKRSSSLNTESKLIPSTQNRYISQQKIKKNFNYESKAQNNLSTSSNMNNNLKFIRKQPNKSNSQQKQIKSNSYNYNTNSSKKLIQSNSNGKIKMGLCFINNELQICPYGNNFNQPYSRK